MSAHTPNVPEFSDPWAFATVLSVDFKHLPTGKVLVKRIDSVWSAEQVITSVSILRPGVGYSRYHTTRAVYFPGLECNHWMQFDRPRPYRVEVTNHGYYFHPEG